MQNHVLGTLHVYIDDADPNLRSVYELAEGDNFVGGSLFCDVKLAYANIDDLHCKISLTPKGEYSLEDLSNMDHGIYRAINKNYRQRLKPNKEYELLPERPFYLANKYKCIFKPKGHPGSFDLSSKLDQFRLGIPKGSRSSSSLPAHDQEEEDWTPQRATGTTNAIGLSEEPSIPREVPKIENAVQISKNKKTPKRSQDNIPVESKDAMVEEPIGSVIRAEKHERQKEEKNGQYAGREKREKEMREEVRTSLPTEPSDTVVKEKNAEQKTEEKRELPKEAEEPKFRPKEKKEEIPKKISKDKMEIEHQAEISREKEIPPQKGPILEKKESEKIVSEPSPKEKPKVESPPELRKEEKSIKEEKPITAIPVESAVEKKETQSRKASGEEKKQASTPNRKVKELTSRLFDEKETAGTPKITSKQSTVLFEDEEDEFDLESDRKILKKQESAREKENHIQTEQQMEEIKRQRSNDGSMRESQNATPIKYSEENRPRRQEIEETPDLEKRERSRIEEDRPHRDKYQDEEHDFFEEDFEEGHIGDDYDRYKSNLSREQSSKKDSLERRRREPDERGSDYKYDYRDRGKPYDKDRRRDYERDFDKGRDWNQNKERERESERDRERDRERGMFDRRRDDRDLKDNKPRERDDKGGRPMYPRERMSEKKEEGEISIQRRRKDERDPNQDFYQGRDDKFRDYRYDKDDKDRPRDDRPFERKTSNYEDNKSSRSDRSSNYNRQNDSHRNPNINNQPERLNIVKRDKDPRDYRGGDRQMRDKPLHRQWSDDKSEEEKRMQNFPQYLFQQPQHQPPPPAREPKKTGGEAPPIESGKESKGKDEFKPEREFEGLNRRRSVNEPRDQPPDTKGKSKVQQKVEAKNAFKSAIRGNDETSQEPPNPNLNPNPELTIERKKSEGHKATRESSDALHKYEKISTSSKKQKMSEDYTGNEGLNFSGKASTTQNKASPIPEEAGEHAPEKEVRQKHHQYYIMFSGFEREDREVDEAKKKLSQLGLKIVEEKERTFNVLVLKKFKRTVKFLLALNKGVDIVSFDWVRQCIKEEKVLPPINFIFSDRTAESRFKFKLSTSLQKARRKKQGFLRGFKVFFPIDILPSLEEMKLLVESADGITMRNRPMQYREDILIVLNEDDKRNATSFKDLGFTPHSSELVFSGILRQELNLEENKL